MYQKELEIAKMAAREAGAAIKDLFFGEFEVSQKDDRSYVTTADLESEKKIFEIIKAQYPDHSILSEEAGEEEGGDSDFKWIIDPLDGTTNFSKRIPFFNVAIALEHKGRIVLGVVYQPITDEMFYAEAGRGAYLNGKEISVSEKEYGPDAYFTFCNGWKPEDKVYMIKAVEKIKPEAKEIRKLGSADLELVYLACGRTEGFFAKGVKIVDFKPGCIIAQEAGAVVTDFKGKDWQDNPEGDVLAAASKEIHVKMLNIVKDHE